MRERSPTSLDPADWEAFAADAHRALDMMIAHLKGAADGPVWRETPVSVRESFTESMPREGAPLGDLIDRFDREIRPYATGNTHPLFLGWVHGAGTPAGMIADMLAAGLNANCGGRNHVGLVVEEQVTRWAADLFGFPETASGIFVTGTSQANQMGVLVAKTARLGAASRANGLAGAPRLTAYASAEAHQCIAQAMEMAGLGSAQLRRVPVDRSFRMDPVALEAMIAADRAEGATPFLVVGTAGTVNTGAIDPLAEIGAIARREGLWFHVDGAFGALLALHPELRNRLAGIETARSIGFDFHKWGHVPYDAGFLLVRDAAIHKATFASPANYLSRLPRGLSAGETWPCDLGPDLSRGFRALKTWFTVQAVGTDAIGAAMAENCRLAGHLARLIDASGVFERVADVPLNIVCFSLVDDPTGADNRELVMMLHESGFAAPSLTRIGQRTVIRAAIVNHRTTEADIESFVVACHAAALRRHAILMRAAVSTPTDPLPRVSERA